MWRSSCHISCTWIVSLLHGMALQVYWFWKDSELSPVWVLSWIFTRYGNAPVTFVTLQWFLLFMDPLIVHQGTWFWKVLATLWSIGWLLSSVITFMNLNLMWKNVLHGSFNGTFNILILRSSCHIYALEWFLSSVIPFMNCHRCGKALETSMVSFLHGSFDGTLNMLILRSPCHTLCTCMASLQCDFFDELSPDVEKLLRL